ncbi:uncharacterized protein LOC115458322 isoform X1 [Microcaecilia unicolor]|uniref:Uncharacterized protein LOC115458322 isoform X1 n=1 Tax=Microcaecilia unicolor TaxID=1415580 RepID=A0A6P7WSA4_9AMPH|nr:uncharacterized protein LOC115458322 isoform X1 [Microcaecilia unicolor]
MPGPGRNEVVPCLLALLISAVQLNGSADNVCVPNITDPKTNLNLLLGSTLLLNCTIQACPHNDSLLVTWAKMQSEQYISINASQIYRYHWRKEDKLKVVSLKIPEVMPEDEGLYRCQVSQGDFTAMGLTISVHLRNATETSISQAEEDKPHLSPETQSSNLLHIVASILGTAVLLLLLGSSLWKFCLKDLLRGRSSTHLRKLQNDIHCEKVKEEEEITYTTIAFSERPWPAVQTCDTQGSSEYAILRYEPPPSLSATRTTTTANSNHYSSV